MTDEGGDLDPRIQIELENLNSATDEINKLEIELEEAISTFNILSNESTRRLTLLSKKFGNCIEKARPYYKALELARKAQIECQIAAAEFHKANEIHAAAKELVALAEQRFMSNSHEWKFDNAWQDMLNQGTQKVMDAEIQKGKCHTEHQKNAQIFNAAELKVQQLEERFRRSIQKSRPYFEEKQICEDQLLTQKKRIKELQGHVQVSKSTYSTALRNLEQISEEIHKKRGDLCMVAPPGPREPGVGAELSLDFNFELEKCDHPSIMGSEMSLQLLPSNSSTTILSQMDLADDIESDFDESDERGMCSGVDSYRTLNPSLVEDDVEKLKEQVRNLAVRPVEGGDGQQEQDVWENELNATVNKLDHLMMIKESSTSAKLNRNSNISSNSKYNNTVTKSNITEILPINKHLIIGVNSVTDDLNSLPATPQKLPAIKMLLKSDPLPSVNVSMRELPLLARLSTEVFDKQMGYTKQRRRSLE